MTGASSAALRTAVMKYWICKRAPVHAAEALECLGGNGFVEDSGLPAVYRGAPINSIWEGSGNVAALDVLRALAREPEAVAAFRAECELARGANRHLDAHLTRSRALMRQRVRRPAHRRASGACAAGLAARAPRAGSRR